MAEDTADDLIYWLKIDIEHKNYLGRLRHWDNLKMATDAQCVWVKDFTAQQLSSAELKSIPFAALYYCKEDKLFPKGSLLPERKLPVFLWTPVERALPVELQGYNHNFFGIHQQQPLRLVPCEEEQKATVLLTGIQTAHDYIVTAPSVRLKNLQWLLINNNEALIFGEPLLPLNGRSYWQKERFILPVGYNFEFAILEKIAAQQIDEEEAHLIWWQNENNYCLLHRAQLQPLSIASWKQTAINI
ncbi:hypothetical protein [Ferruginibacter sp.]